MNTDLILLNTTEPVGTSGFRHKMVIQEFECGLLYRHGKFVGSLGAGRHIRWGFGYALAKMDLRKQTFPISGQEVLSADNVGIKVSVAVTMQVSDPIKAINVVQLALRSTIAAQPVEALLTQRLEIGKQLLSMVQTEAEKVGVTLHATEVKDVMFPGELKKVFAQVLQAKQEGQAALERARGESAALRNLANAARLLDNNPALQNLRLMQSITAAGAAGNTLVMGLPSGFLPLKNNSAPRAGDPKDGGVAEQ
jgi:regulator of protease activity HflC (stomatin/prohibitin superfamily)